MEVLILKYSDKNKVDDFMIWEVNMALVKLSRYVPIQYDDKNKKWIYYGENYNNLIEENKQFSLVMFFMIVSSLFCKFSSGLDSQGFSLIRLCRNPLNP